jgi:hypothetical protein
VRRHRNGGGCLELAEGGVVWGVPRGLTDPRVNRPMAAKNVFTGSGRLRGGMRYHDDCALTKGGQFGAIREIAAATAPRTLSGAIFIVKTNCSGCPCLG